MKNIFCFFLILISIWLLASTQVLANIFGWQVFETPHARIFYKEKYRDIARYTAEVFEAYRDRVANLVRSDPGKINIVIVDQGTFPEGIALSINKTIYLFTWPPEEEIALYCPTDSLWRHLIVHEFTHLCDFSREKGLPAVLDKIFFGTYGFFGSWLRSPFKESTTVFAESFFSPYSGRLNNPLSSKALWANRVQTNDMPKLSELILAPPDEFMGARVHYLIPSGFYQYLSKTYGHEKVKKFLDETSSKFMGIGINKSAHKVFGKNLDTLYQEWIAYLKKNSPKYKNQGKELITEKHLLIFDITGDDDNTIYFVAIKYSPYTIISEKENIFLGQYNVKTKTWQKIKSIRTKYISHIKKIKNYIYLRTYEIKPHKTGDLNLSIAEGFSSGSAYILSSIRRIDLKTNKETEIYEGLVSSYDVAEDETVYASIFNPSKMESEIYEIYPKKKKLFTVKGIVRELRVNKNKILALLVTNEGFNGKIYTFDGKNLKLLTDDPFIKGSITWANETHLYFTAAYKKDFFNIYSLNIKTKTIKALTKNSVFIKPLVLKEKIYALGYSNKVSSLTIYEINPEEETIDIPSAKPVPVERKHIRMTKINGDIAYLKSLAIPGVRIPIVISGEQGSALGVYSLHMGIDGKMLLTIMPLGYLKNKDNHENTQMEDLQFLGSIRIIKIFPKNFIVNLYYSKFNEDVAKTMDVDEETLSFSLSKILAELDLAIDKQIWLASSIAFTQREDIFETSPSFSVIGLFGEVSSFWKISYTLAEDDKNISFLQDTIWGVHKRTAIHFTIEGKYDFDNKDLSLTDSQLGLRFFLTKIKKGRTDPYVYVNNLYFTPMIGYDDEGFYGGGYLSTDFANFIFPFRWFVTKVGIKIKKEKVETFIKLDMPL